MNSTSKRTKTTGIAAKLKRRFAQLLLNSSCTAAAAAVAGESKPPPAATPLPSALDLGCCHRRKLDLTVDRRLRRVAPLAHAAIDCAAAPRSADISSLLHAAVLTKEEEDAKQGRKIHSFPKQSSVTARRARKKKALFSNAYGFTSSSNSSSSGGEEEQGVDEEPSAALLLSTKSFFSDSCEFYRRSKKKKKKKKHMQNSYYCGDQLGRRPVMPISSKEKPESGFRAVVKRSSNPYYDFRSSMAEMMAERGISGGRELKQLLRSYLALNSPRHHQVIRAAFADTWEFIFAA